MLLGLRHLLRHSRRELPQERRRPDLLQKHLRVRKLQVVGLRQRNRLRQGKSRLQLLGEDRGDHRLRVHLLLELLLLRNLGDPARLLGRPLPELLRQRRHRLLRLRQLRGPARLPSELLPSHVVPSEGSPAKAPLALLYAVFQGLEVVPWVAALELWLVEPPELRPELVLPFLLWLLL